jgi:hypothetical protein
MSKKEKQVVDFYCRDDISRQAPGIKDYVRMDQPDGGKEDVQKRHLMMTLKEAHGLLKMENGHQGVYRFTKFAELRPDYVALSSQMPHNVCCCKMHEDFIRSVKYRKIILVV